jgi:hypothetical protein
MMKGKYKRSSTISKRLNTQQNKQDKKALPEI